MRGVDEKLMVISISSSDNDIKFNWAMSDYMCSEREADAKKDITGMSSWQ